ncbi:hypothetical protein [Alcaligenes sp. WGS1538]|uniref:hypothetical protein n=1 Tax=Alcaligenes sp. WGS1538 TaxID=3366811 RepID=UPI00372D61BC
MSQARAEIQQSTVVAFQHENTSHNDQTIIVLIIFSSLLKVQLSRAKKGSSKNSGDWVAKSMPNWFFEDAVQGAGRSDGADGLPARRAGALVGALGRARR